ncbi:glutathione hydrolase 1 proenzyme, partial [Aplysia californica]|uniref:Glutathione hydrolase 1 proenzyme n=1 Tax=Aplysia californica TaxID=6500 RepID=A0ABM1A914_APLCA
MFSSFLPFFHDSSPIVSTRTTRMVCSVTSLRLLAVLALAQLVTGFLVGHSPDRTFPKPGRGDEGLYHFAAVASNADPCAEIGTELMAKKRGSAVDAAIASMLCVGVTRFQSSGLGGGHFSTIYDRASRKVHSIIARTMAPSAANSTMFINDTVGVTQGGRSIAVPGEILGFWEAHKLQGRLPWRDLFQPAIKLATEGFPVEPSTAAAIQSKIPSGIFDTFPTLKAIVTNPITGTWYKEGEMIRRPKLARTLQRIADGGAAEFYNGSLADDIVKEIQGAGGIITKQDLADFYADVTSPLSLALNGGLTIYSPPLPSSGVIAQNILNILSGYNMTSAGLSTNEKTVLTYHRFIEAFKHAYAARSKLGSPYGETKSFGDEMNKLIANLTSPDQGESIRSQIWDNQTFPWSSYGAEYYSQDDHGTSQLCVLAPNGDAVSMTSTINLFFGSKIVGETTGITYNDDMDDFSTPGIVNAFGVAPSSFNFIKPGKRPMSSMSPSIILDDQGSVRLVIG